MQPRAKALGTAQAATGALAGAAAIVALLVAEAGLGPDSQERGASHVLLAFALLAFAVSTLFLRQGRRLVTPSAVLSAAELVLLAGCAAGAVGAAWGYFVEGPEGGAMPLWAFAWLLGLGLIAVGHAMLAVGLFRLPDAGVLGLGPMAVAALLVFGLAIPWEDARTYAQAGYALAWAAFAVAAGRTLPRMAARPAAR